MFLPGRPGEPGGPFEPCGPGGPANVCMEEEHVKNRYVHICAYCTLHARIEERKAAWALWINQVFIKKDSKELRYQ